MVRIGPGSRIRSPGIPSRNIGQSVAAQNRLDRIVDAESRKIQEALQVDGPVLRVWQPLKYGIVCTCKNAPSNRPIPINAPTQGLDTADSPNRVIFKVRNIDPQLDNAKPPIANNTPLDTIEDAIYNSYEPTDGENDEEFLSKLLQNDDDIVNSLIDENAYVIQSKNTCAICFGTGYVGGYSLYGGIRHILDNSGATTLTLYNGTYIRNTAQPNEFVIKPGKYIQFTSQMPSYFTALAGPIFRNNKALVNGLSIAYSIDGNVWFSNISALPTQRGDNVYFLVGNISNNDIIFTHVEHYLSYVLDLKGQIGNLHLNSGNDYFKSTAATTIVLPASIGPIDRNSYISDSKYGFFWRIDSINTISTAKNQNTSIECEAQLVRPLEPIEILNFGRKSIINTTYSGVNSPLFQDAAQVADIGAFQGIILQQVLDLFNNGTTINYPNIPYQYIAYANQEFNSGPMAFTITNASASGVVSGNVEVILVNTLYGTQTTIGNMIVNEPVNGVLNEATYLTNTTGLTFISPNQIQVVIPLSIMNTLNSGVYNLFVVNTASGTNTILVTAVINIV